MKKVGSTCTPQRGNHPTINDAITACKFDPKCKGIANLYCDDHAMARNYHLCLADSRLVASSGCIWEKKEGGGKQQIHLCFVSG